MINRKVGCFCFCCIALSVGVATAQNHAQIIAIDSDEVEAKVDGGYEYIPKEKIGSPPIPILQKDNRNYFLIEVPDGRKLWVSGSDVITSKIQDLRPNCSGMKISKKPDAKILGARGVGEKCK